MIRHFCLTLFVLLSVIIGCNKENGQEETNGIPKGAVDMGLSVYWAECNLGAETSYDFGDHYAWGETSTKDISDYTWEKYKYSTGDFWEDNLVLLKYNTIPKLGNVDNKVQLELSDDVAHTKLGGKWRMPTVDEFKELYDNCTWEFSVRNGIQGVEGKSKRNGNTIFLPAANEKDRGGHSVLTEGYYWSSSLYMYSEDENSSAYADYLYFMIKKDNSLYFNAEAASMRFAGYSIRPVTE